MYFGYDDAGRPDEMTDGRGRTARASYDAGGWLDTTTTAEGVTFDVAFDRGGLVDTVVDELLNGVDHDYDGAGRLKVRTDQRDHTTTWGYDDAGRVDEIIDNRGKKVRLGYDDAGQLTSYTDAALRTFELRYDKLGNLERFTDPLLRSWSWTYDELGRLNTRTDPRDQFVDWTWDAASRLDLVNTPAGPIDYQWDDAGRPESMADPTGVTAWGFDDADRLTSIASPAGALSFGYDAGGLRERLTLPQGSVSTTYDDARGVDRMSDWTGAWADFDVDGDGMVRRTERSNGVVTAVEPDEVGRVRQIAHTGPGGPVDSFVYGYDEAGNRETVTSSAGVESYVFDDLDRIESASYPDGTSQSWTYHDDGSRKTETTGGITSTYFYDDAGQLDRIAASSGDVDYDHDAAGNLTVAGADRFGWDWDNRLTTATVGGEAHSYSYDGNGLRTVADGVGQLWDPSGELPVLVGAGGTAYLHSPAGGLHSQIAPGGAHTTALTDALGSTRAVADGSGAVAGRSDYRAFGAVRASSGPATAFGFAGEVADPTGLIHLRARAYDPARGQFLSPDTVLPNAPATQGWNRYAYVANNPTTWVDPSGHTAIVEYAQNVAQRAKVAFATSRLGRCLTGAFKEIAEGLAWAPVMGGPNPADFIIDGSIGCVTGGVPGPGPSSGVEFARTGEDLAKFGRRLVP